MLSSSSSSFRPSSRVGVRGNGGGKRLYPLLLLPLLLLLVLPRVDCVVVDMERGISPRSTEEISSSSSPEDERGSVAFNS